MPLPRLKRWTTRLWRGQQAASQDETSSQEVARAKENWEALGTHDPLWAIVSVPDKRGNRWELDEFFSNGALEIQHLVKALGAAGIVLPGGRALDFGCGVGRLTQALADRFDEVDGVDIAAPMVEQARGYNRHGDRVRYHCSAAATLPFDDATFDFVFSKIVLQHVAVGLQRAYVREFIRVVRPAGLVVFQAVARALAAAGSHFESPIETPGGTFSIDMNVFPRDDVQGTIRSSGGRLLHMLEDVSAGEAFESVFYVAAADRRVEP